MTGKAIRAMPTIPEYKGIPKSPPRDWTRWDSVTATIECTEPDCVWEPKSTPNDWSARSQADRHYEHTRHRCRIKLAFEVLAPK